MNDSAQTDTNRIDPAILGRFNADLDRHEEEMASQRGVYMAFCKGRREMIDAVFEAAGNAGIPKKAFKVHRKAAKLEEKARSLIDELEGDEAESVEMIRSALGHLDGTPLGRAALKEDDGTDVRPDFLRNKEALDALGGDDGPDVADAVDSGAIAGAENAAKIRKGIKPLSEMN